MVSPRDRLVELVGSEEGVVRVESEEEARAVVREAARPEYFRIERDAEGGWLVRHEDPRG